MLCAYSTVWYVRMHEIAWHGNAGTLSSGSVMRVPILVLVAWHVGDCVANACVTHRFRVVLTSLPVIEKGARWQFGIQQVQEALAAWRHVGY